MSTQVVVLGMHRSGTSTVALMLEELGVNIGENLLGAEPGNPYGHGEDLDFLQLNDGMLRSMNSSWDFPPSPSRVKERNAAYEEQISDLIKEKDEQSLWAWKEPRTSILINHYRPHLTDPKYIIVGRDPLDVAKSLKKRNRMPLFKGRKLHERYTQSINDLIVDLKEEGYLYINFKDLHSDTEKVVKNMIDFLDLSTDENKQNQAVNVVRPLEKVRKKGKASKKDIWKGNLQKAVRDPFKAVSISGKNTRRVLKYYFK